MTDDAELERIIDASAGEWHDDEFRINAGELMDMLRAASRTSSAFADEAPMAFVTDNYSRDGYNDEISSLLPVGTKLYARPAHSGWLPIESAPKDCSRILLFIPNPLGDCVWTGMWCDEWIVSYGKAFQEPTHWQPLPAGPGRN